MYKQIIGFIIQINHIVYCLKLVVKYNNSNKFILSTYLQGIFIPILHKNCIYNIKYIILYNKK